MLEKEYLNVIIKELEEASKLIKEEELEKAEEMILSAKKIFVAGAGRSGFAARAFSNRLMHLGLQVYFVGEPTTPAIGKGDLCIIASGSGETKSLVAMAQKVKAVGASLLTITIFPEASIGTMADHAVVLPGATPKSDLENTFKSEQPMGNVFEQMSWIIYDVMIRRMMDLMNRTADEMFKLHANLE